MKQTSRGLAPSLNTGHSTFTGARQRLAVALVAIFIAFAGAQTATAAVGDVVATGYCGTTANGADGHNLAWTLTENGEADIVLTSETYTALTLTITGTGAMDDYTSSSYSPWNATNNYRYRVTKLVLPEGITHIGNHAFYFTNFTGKLTIPSTVQTIGANGFYGFHGATSVTIPASVTSIGEKALQQFGKNASSCTVTFAEGSQLASIGANAFERVNANLNMTNCTQLTAINAEEVFMAMAYTKTVTFPRTMTSVCANAFKIISGSGKPNIYMAYNGILIVNGTMVAEGTGTKGITSYFNVTTVGSNAVTMSGDIGLTWNAEGEYYEINDEQDLIDLGDFVGGCSANHCEGMTFKLTRDLDFTNMPTRNVNGNSGNFHPIGLVEDDSHNGYFKGHFDGQNHTIKALRYTNVISSNDNPSSNTPVGLFKYLNGSSAVVERVVLIDPQITGRNSGCGGIAGFMGDGATIRNCTVLGGFIAQTDNGRSGGIVGKNWNAATIEGCTVIGTSVQDGKIFGSDTPYQTIKDCIYYDPDGRGIARSNDGYTDGGGNQRVYQLTLGEGITASGATYSHVLVPDKAYYANGSTVTLGHGTREGYVFDGYTASPAQTISDGTFTMPAEDVTVGATWTIDPAHFSVNGEGTEYTIHTATGWGVFCDCLDDNDTYNRFSGKTVKLGANITVSRMAGSDHHDFCGTFDGQEHTLTFNYGTSGSYASDEYAAPFHYVSNVGSTAAAFRNLHVAGHIYTSAKYAAGLIAQHWGTVNVENCRVSTVIHSSVSGDGTHGGFEAECKGVLNITGCVFDGKLLTTNGTFNCGGFVGWHNGGTTNISNSLYAPAAIAADETEVGPGTAGQNPSATFGRNAVNSIANSYYTRALGTPQGKQLRTIAAGEGVTLGHDGVATEYSVSGITAYKASDACGDDDPFIAGIIYNNVLYAGSGDAVILTLRNTPPAGYKIHSFTTEPDGATLSSGSPSGDGGAFYTLTMPNADITIGATWIEYEGDGTAEHPYVIYDWNIFCGWMTNDYDNSKDKYYMLGADVSATTMVGTSDYPFCGTFDGNGHTLTLDYGSAENPFTESFCAPFRYVSGTSSAPVVIKNLHVAGNMNTIKAYGAGFVGKVMENGKVTIENCRSSVDIESTRDDDAFHSGFVSRALEGAIITIKDCVFDGSFKAPKCKRCAGFFASSQPGTFKVIENCLFAPTDCSLAEVNMDDSHRTFARGSNYTITNCYYTQELGGSQGEKGILLYDGGVPATANEGVIGKCINEQYDVKLQGRTLYKDGKWNTLCLPFALGDDQAESGHELDGTPLEGATLMTLGNSPACKTGFDPQTGTLNLDFLPATTVEPGVAYIVKWPIPDGMTADEFAAAYAANPDDYDLKNPVFTGVTVTNDAPADHATTSLDGYVTFVGTYGPAAIYADPAVNLYLGAANKLYWPTATDFELKPFRAYFQLNNGLTAGDPSNPNAARAITLNFGDASEETGIREIVTDPTPGPSPAWEGSAAGWYTLDGRRIDGKPTKRGLYINNGKKVAIK